MISLKVFHSILPAVLMNKFFVAMLRDEKKTLNRGPNSSLLTFKPSFVKENQIGNIEMRGTLPKC